MGFNNLKFESEVFTTQTPQFQGGITPVETKPDTTLLIQLVSQVGQLHQAVNQIGQVVLGQSFTRAVPQGGEVLIAADEIRKLNQRLDDLEARVPQKGKEAKA